MVHKIQNVVIAGAGIMGASIARLFASFQYRVTLYDISREALDKSRELIFADNEQGTGMAKEGGMLAEGKVCKVREDIVFSSDKECFGQADFVIEAIVEKMEIKHRFFEEISRLVPERAVLTSNTSGLSLTEIAKAVYLP